MGELYTFWKDKVGVKVIFTGKLLSLDEGTVGVLKSVYDDWCVIVYPQHQAYEEDGNGSFKLIKGAPNKVYAHSAKLTEIKLSI